MQIAWTCKGCTCDKCETFKEKNPKDKNLNNEKYSIARPSHPRTFARSRQTKMKMRNIYGNHHRLDHTYAAAANFNDILYLKPIESTISSSNKLTNHWFKNHESLCVQKDKRIALTDANHQNQLLNGKNDSAAKTSTDLLFSSTKDKIDDLSLKSTWLRNLCLEYQPSKNVNKLQNDVCLDGVLKSNYTSFHFSGMSGTLKQYQRNRKIIKNKTDLSSSFIGKSKIIRSVQEDKKRWIAALALIELAQSK